jgi:hypothetical protein
MTRTLFPKLAALLLGAFAVTGCAPAVGDSCETSAECPSEAICDVTAPGGYCTIPECDVESCPEKTVCVEFNDEESYCMEWCDEDRMCRTGYVCRTDVGPAGFCYVSP